MKIIRVKGIAFLVITVIGVVLLGYVFAGSIIKAILESQLTSLNQAEVNIGEVNVSYIPLGLEIKKIQATDSRQPELNLIAMDRAALALKTHSLLKGRFVISDLTVDNIEFATQRKKKGFVVTPEAEDIVAEQEAESSMFGSLELPSADDLIQQAGLESDQAFKLLDEKAKASKQSWQEIEQWYDDKAKWQLFETRYKQIERDLKKGNLKQKAQALKDLKVLQKDIKAEFKEFDIKKKQLKDDYQALELAYKEAKAAPAKDFEKIKSSYSLDAGNLENITRLVFGDQVAYWTGLAQEYYKKIEPYLGSDEEEQTPAVAREKGRWITFTEYEPEPEFLIERAGFTAQMTSGKFDGIATNIGSDQSINNKPAVIELKGRELKHSKAESMMLTLDFRDNKRSVVDFSYLIDDRNISDYKISGDKKLPLTMKQAVLDLDAEVKLINRQLEARADSQFNNVTFESSHAQGSKLPDLIAAAFTDIDRFDINATATGKMLKPKLKIKSDIDNKLNKGLKVRFEQIKKDYEKELKAKFDAKYKDELVELENKMSEIRAFRQSLENKQRDIEARLNKYKK